jgi:hypothetical protein
MSFKIRLGVMTQKENSDSTKDILDHLHLTLGIVCPGSVAVQLPWMGAGTFKAKVTNIIFTPQINIAFKQIYNKAIITNESDGFLFTCDLEKMKQYILLDPIVVLEQYLQNQSNRPRVQIERGVKHTKSASTSYLTAFMFLVLLLIILVGDKISISSFRNLQTK